MNAIRDAVAWMDRGGASEAKSLWKRALIEYPAALALHLELVNCMRRTSSSLSKWRECSDFYESLESPLSPRGLAHFVQAEQLVHEERYDAAIIQYRAAEESGLTDPLVPCRLGEALRRAGRYADAVEAFETALRIDPTYLPARYALADWHFSEGSFAACQNLARRLGKKKSGAAEVYVPRAQDYAKRLATMAAAVRALREGIRMRNEGDAGRGVLHLWPFLREYRTNLPLIHTIVQLLSDAEWLLTGARRIGELFPGQDRHAHFAHAEILRCQGQHAEAVEHYTKALEAGLHHPLLTYALATLAEDPRLDDALYDSLVEAHTRQPWSAFGRVALGRAALHRSRHELAAECASPDGEIRRNSLTYDAMGASHLCELRRTSLRALMQAGEISKASAHARTSIKTQTSGALILTECAVFEKSGSFALARERLKLAIETENRVMAEATEDERRSVEALYQQFPEDAYAGLAVALIRLREDDRKKARQVLARVRDLHPDEPHCSSFWAFLLRLDGRHDDAVPVLEKVLDANPSNELALRLLCEIRTEKGDLHALLKLHDAIPSSTLVLESALQTARATGADEAAHAIAEKILSLDPGDIAALGVLVGPRAEHILHAGDHVRRYCRLKPLEFDLVRGWAHVLLEAGQLEEAREPLNNLILYGDRQAGTLYKYALCNCALAIDQK